MRSLSSKECNYISGGNDDSSKVLTTHGIGITSSLGGLAGGFLGFCYSTSYPIAGTIGGIATGMILTPIAITLFAKGMTMSWEMFGVI